jgi:hypothetical protein
MTDLNVGMIILGKLQRTLSVHMSLHKSAFPSCILRANYQDEYILVANTHETRNMAVSTYHLPCGSSEIYSRGVFA